MRTRHTTALYESMKSAILFYYTKKLQLWTNGLNKSIWLFIKLQKIKNYIVCLNMMNCYARALFAKSKI